MALILRVPFFLIMHPRYLILLPRQRKVVTKQRDQMFGPNLTAWHFTLIETRRGGVCIFYWLLLSSINESLSAEHSLRRAFNSRQQRGLPMISMILPGEKWELPLSIFCEQLLNAMLSNYYLRLSRYFFYYIFVSKLQNKGATCLYWHFYIVSFSHAGFVAELVHLKRTCLTSILQTTSPTPSRFASPHNFCA